MTQLSKRILFKSRISGQFEEEKKFDFYPTPEWSTKLMLEYVNIPRQSRVLEPCNGIGSISDVLRERERES